MDFLSNGKTSFLKARLCMKVLIHSIGFGQKSCVIFPSAGAL